MKRTPQKIILLESFISPYKLKNKQMKKVSAISIFLSIFLFFASNSLSAQSTKLDFSMQFQNSNQNQAVIYPNPIQSPVFKIKANAFITHVDVVNMVGKKIFEKDYNTYSDEELTIQLPNCDKGIYLVKITFDNNETIIKKLLYQ